MNAQKSRKKANGGKKTSQGNRPQQPVKSLKGKKPKVALRTNRQVSVAAAYSTGQSSRAPIITMTRDKCRIRHRELVASVTGSAAFTTGITLPINPGLANSFPWLSVTAPAWEQYDFIALKYCYYTRTGSNTPGSVMMYVDYDAADAAPASEQIASSYEGVAEDAPWKDIMCVARRQSMIASQKHHYVRSGALAPNLDIKTYDVGTFFLSTVDGTAVPWGKLWVEYDVEFTLPQLPPTGTPFSLSGGRTTGGGTRTAANPFGTVPVVDPAASGVAMSNSSVLTFANAGDYLVSTTYTGTVITALGAPVLVGTAILGSLSVFDGGGLNAVCTYIVRADQGGTMAFSLTATTVTASACYVGQAPVNGLS